MPENTRHNFFEKILKKLLTKEYSGDIMRKLLTKQPAFKEFRKIQKKC